MRKRKLMLDREIVSANGLNSLDGGTGGSAVCPTLYPDTCNTCAYLCNTHYPYSCVAAMCPCPTE